MKIARILSAAAAVAVTSAMAVSVSADYIVPESHTSYILQDNSSNFGFAVYATGEGDCPKSTLNTDANFDINDVAYASVIIEIPEEEREWWSDETNQFSGAFIYSIHTDTDKSTKNWMTAGEWWGINDEEIGVVTQDAENPKPVVAETLGDYTYKLTCAIPNELDQVEGNLVQYRIFVSAWDAGNAMYKVKEATLSDASGNVLVTLDGTGEIISAPNAGAASDTTTGTDTGKGSPDTGIEGVAAVAGLGVVAAGAVLLSRKRK